VRIFLRQVRGPSGPDHRGRRTTGQGKGDPELIDEKLKVSDAVLPQVMCSRGDHGSKLGAGGMTVVGTFGFWANGLAWPAAAGRSIAEYNQPGSLRGTRRARNSLIHYSAAVSGGADRRIERRPEPNPQALPVRRSVSQFSECAGQGDSVSPEASSRR